VLVATKYRTLVSVQHSRCAATIFQRTDTHREEQKAAITNPRAVDLSGVQLTLSSASILSDVFMIEWGLHKLVFRECNLDEHVSPSSAPEPQFLFRFNDRRHSNPFYTRYLFQALYLSCQSHRTGASRHLHSD